MHGDDQLLVLSMALIKPVGLKPRFSRFIASYAVIC